MTTDTIRDVMTPDPVALAADTTLAGAAQVMRDAAIGDILVTRDDLLVGILTDRDIVVRGVAKGLDPMATSIERCLSSELVVVEANDNVGDAVRLFRERAIRRAPVVDDGAIVGIVSLGDLARERDPQSALADISSAPPNV